MRELCINVAQAAVNAAKVHLELCEEALYEMEEGDYDIDTPAQAPFCGCQTCVVREVCWAYETYIDECGGLHHGCDEC